MAGGSQRRRAEPAGGRPEPVGGPAEEPAPVDEPELLLIGPDAAAGPAGAGAPASGRAGSAASGRGGVAGRLARRAGGPRGASGEPWGPPAERPPAGPGAPAAPAAGGPGAGAGEGPGVFPEQDLPPPVDPAPLGWFLLSVVYAVTALYTAVPAAGTTLFGAGPEGGGRMAVALVVLPYLFAGLYTGLTHGGRGWVYPVTFAAWPLLLERLALYLFGFAGRWMQEGFPDGWREALPVASALAFTREALAPYATPAYGAAGAASLALTVAVFFAVRWAEARWRLRRAVERPGPGSAPRWPRLRRRQAGAGSSFSRSSPAAAE
ncbi:hypothetical protein [Thermaerobacter litoralis]